MKYLILIFLPLFAHAETIASASQNNVTISLTNEPCASQSVKNLPYRAIWTEPNGKIEGCYGVQSGTVVMLYFEDKTVAVLPTQVFQKVTDI